MKTQRSFIISLVILLILSLCTKADIIPAPIQVKGIVPSHPVNIQMVSERVNVQLSMDSSWVECTFNMHNLGGPQDLEIGFPMMNFYLFQDKYPDQDKFKVWVDGKEIKKIDMYIPDSLKTLLKSEITFEHNNLLSKYNNQNKPWYLWKAHFNKNESQVIIVKYILPNGVTHQNRFFNYLLSTGAGWKGKIERAEININIIDIPSDQILSIAPKHNELKDKQIKWVFKNLKPTTSNDILIKYEMKKGSYKEEMKKIDSMALFLDNKRIWKRAYLNKIQAKDLASININGKPPYEKYGAMFFYTNKYAFKNFKEKIKTIDRKVWIQILNESMTTFSQNYSLKLNDSLISKNHLFEEMLKIDTTPILKINVKSVDSTAKEIILLTK